MSAIQICTLREDKLTPLGGTGSISLFDHREVGAKAATVVDALVVVGPRGRWIGDAARASGLAAVIEVDDADAAASVLDRDLAPGAGDVVLVKASRGIALDRTVELLVGRRPWA